MRRGAAEHRELLAHQHGDAIMIANEFAEVRVRRVETRNGSRLLIESPQVRAVGGAVPARRSRR